MDNDLHPFFTHIRRFVPLSEEEETSLKKLVEVRTVANKQHLLTDGEICKEKYFIMNGIVRKYVNTQRGDKQIIQFSIENWWITDYTSLESGRPSNCNIQAVEACKLVVLKLESLDQIFTTVPQLERYFRKILQRAYEASITRLHFIFSFTGEERYHQFISAFPEFVQRIPQYMLASYLGFTPEFLSKLRAKRI
jgi:CRP-like cAMP-binding protein